MCPKINSSSGSYTLLISGAKGPITNQLVRPDTFSSIFFTFFNPISGYCGLTVNTASFSLGGCINTHHSFPPNDSDFIRISLFPFFRGKLNENDISRLLSSFTIATSRLPYFSYTRFPLHHILQASLCSICTHIVVSFGKDICV